MQKITVTELKEVSGGGTRIGTTASGGLGLQFVGATDAALLGGRIDPGGAELKATPILF